MANAALKVEIFSLHYLGYAPGNSPSGKVFNQPYYEIFSEIIKHPYDKYFKLDDDVVYIHPGAFQALVQNKNSSKCFMHFFNIAGSNWRCSWLHQKDNVYNETNPKNLRFDYSPNADCGWKNSDCAELTLRTFLHHYKQNQLDRYLFNELYLTTDRKRFSINAFLLDKDLINIKEMLKAGPISKDDEVWWTMKYSADVSHPNCVVGRALVLHFSYFTVLKDMLERGLLQEFEQIVSKNKDSFKVDPSLWNVLDDF